MFLWGNVAPGTNIRYSCTHYLRGFSHGKYTHVMLAIKSQISVLFEITFC